MACTIVCQSVIESATSVHIQYSILQSLLFIVVKPTACTYSYAEGQHLPSFQRALQPGVGLGLLYNMPPAISVPCSVPPPADTHLSQVHGHIV